MSQLDTIYFNEPIASWVEIVHAEVSQLYGMKKIKIKPYGYDSYASVLSAILSNVTTADIMASIRNQHDESKFVELAHGAWVANYLYWKSKDVNTLSDNPKKSINTIDRNDRATTHAKNLNATDLELYTDIISVVFEILTRRIIEAGVQNLHMS